MRKFGWSLAVAIALAGVLPSQDVAALVAALGSDDARARSDAYRELQRTRPPELPALLAAKLPDFPVGGQSQGMYLLQQYPIDRTRPAYRRLLQAEAAFLRGASAAALLRSGESSMAAVVAAAIRAATDEERWLLLGRLFGVKNAAVADAVRELVRPGVRYDGLDNALYHLLTFADGRDEPTVRAAATVLGSDETDDRSCAVCAAYLLAVGEAQHAADLAAALRAEPSILTRLQRYLDRAARLGDEVLDALVEVLEAGENQTQVTYAARILKKHNAQRAVPALRGLLASENEAVRKAALEALTSIPGAMDAKALRQMLASAEAEVVFVAAATLRRMDDLSGLARVLELVRAGGPKKAGAVQVLGGFCVRAAVPPLLDALDDGDVTVRRHAYSALQRQLPSLFPFRRIDLATTGYRPDGSTAERAEGLRQIRAWWDAHGQ